MHGSNRSAVNLVVVGFVTLRFIGASNNFSRRRTNERIYNNHHIIVSIKRRSLLYIGLLTLLFVFYSTLTVVTNRQGKLDKISPSFLVLRIFLPFTISHFYVQSYFYPCFVVHIPIVMCLSFLFSNTKQRLVNVVSRDCLASQYSIFFFSTRFFHSEFRQEKRTYLITFLRIRIYLKNVLFALNRKYIRYNL